MLILHIAQISIDDYLVYSKSNNKLNLIDARNLRSIEKKKIFSSTSKKKKNNYAYFIALYDF